MPAVEPASVGHRLTAADGPGPDDIREVLVDLSDEDWQLLADPPSRLPRIAVLQSQTRPSGATLRNWFFSSASDEKLAGQLSYYTYSLWKAFGAQGELSPAILESNEPRPLDVEDFLRLAESRLGHVGPRMAYLGLASRYGTGSKAALVAWRMIEPMQLLAPAQPPPAPGESDELAPDVAPDLGQQLMLGEDESRHDSEVTTPAAPNDPGPATSASAAAVAAADADLSAIDPADAAAIAAHAEATEAERQHLTALLEDLHLRSPQARAAAESAVETVTLGRAVPEYDRGELDDWSASLSAATATVRHATGLEPREDVASLNAAVHTWLAHREDVHEAMQQAAVNRTVIEHLETTQAERQANLAAIDLAYRGATPQVRQALSVGVSSAQSELADVTAELERAIFRQEALARRQAVVPVLAPDAALPLTLPESDAVIIDRGDEENLAAPAAMLSGDVQWWHYAWSAVLLVGSLGLGIAVGGSVGMDRLGWSMAALTWWALIGPIVVLNAPARWRWTAAVGLALAGSIFATWAYQSSSVCGMTSVVAAFATVPIGLGFTAIAVWWQARRQPGEPLSTSPSWVLAVTWFVFAFALVFLMSVLATPINCTVG